MIVSKRVYWKNYSNQHRIWNPDIKNMICAYFEDMQFLFSAFSKKMRKGSMIYFNVANSGCMV